MLCHEDNLKLKPNTFLPVKDFDHFVDRTMGGIRKMGTSDTDKIWNNMLLKICGDEWRQVCDMFIFMS